MPFTFSHPAIVLPLSRASKKYFSLTGLIIGSIAPDYEYYIRMEIFSNISHTMPGIFLFNLPVAILSTFIFHNIIKKVFVNNLPAFLKDRFYSMSKLNWNQYFKKNWNIVIISILIGIASHIIWDNFTHKDRFFVKLFPILQNNISLFGNDFAIYNIIQHGSNIIGLATIFIFIIFMPKKDYPYSESCTKYRYWTIFFILTVSIAIIRFMFSPELLIKIGNLIVTIISANFISLIITSLLFKSKKTESVV